jgi:hypothetical protein
MGYPPDLASLGQYRLSEIVTPAYAVVDIAASGSRSEIVRRFLLNMTWIHFSS